MSKTVLLVAILILAFVLRFYNLGVNPPSLDWDETSIGWNAYSLLQTGSDEYGNDFPVSIRSFNDYKPPLYTYLTVPSIAIFGLTEFAVRLPSAIAGVLTILVTYLLVAGLRGNCLPRSKAGVTGLLAAFLLAVSPWHIQFSRVAFEANLALFFVVSGVTLLVNFLNRSRFIFISLSVVSFVLSFYSYHSARLIVPLIIVGTGVFYWKIFWQYWRQVLVAGVAGLLLIAPILVSQLWYGKVQSRFSEVSVFSSSGLRENARMVAERERNFRQEDRNESDFLGRLVHNRLVTYGGLFTKGYLDHFNFDFLFLSADNNPRHHAPGTGLLYLVEFPLVLAGLYFLVKNRPGWGKILFVWFLAAPGAAALTSDTPHAVRSLLYLPTYQIITAYGLVNILGWFKVKGFKDYYRSLTITAVAAAFLVNVFYYVHHYHIHLPLEFASGWQYGYRELVAKIKSREEDFRKVYIVDKLGQPYIYFLFYGPSDTKNKNDGEFIAGFGKYRFVNWGQMEDWQKRQLKEDPTVLVVTGENDFFTPNLFTDAVYYPDGKPVFLIGHK